MLNIGGIPYGIKDEEAAFAAVRRNIIGGDRIIRTPGGPRKMIYADWCASGRLYGPIEDYMKHYIGPLVGNTHTGSNATGASMTMAYSLAGSIIRRHVHASPRDVLMFCGTGMTGAVNKLQRLLQIRAPKGLQDRLCLPAEERPVIFITHMEHHSNHISWLETTGEVVMVPPDEQGLVSPEVLDRVVSCYGDRPLKIGAFTACSNVTGLMTPIAELAAVMHRHGGLAFADYSASAPYVDMDMYPPLPGGWLDALYFSPHKFLGGPGTSGVLVMHGRLLGSSVPDEPGGGTVIWTDPWGKRTYLGNAEEREDGGTPGFLQAIRAALCIKLKEELGTGAMLRREERLLERLWPYLDSCPGLHVLEGRHRCRLGIVSFHIEGLHYKLVTRLLNDKFGIQARGGCSCSGSYGHYLYGIGPDASDYIHHQILSGNLEWKPGWVRISLHPAMSEEEVDAIGRAVRDIARHGRTWGEEYRMDRITGEVIHTSGAEAAEWDATEELEAEWQGLLKQSLQLPNLQNVHRGIVEGNPALVPHVAQLP
ncbi:aminotransferase class V-fold PLP-dependent enzyme [Paenibacillus sp. YN15]|uniref:aminotransferase class V-fold PLP-dependent enzyme n=1 Tax=Paenibacillus sp. YN15 TaxID=1742774 RepID=UPI000DCD0ECF|nr:aminotransferase class V-fold PLP-dependent enzyme [Paenibacillus sp. YN15]RAV05640.1 selenocysteine lyase [Paenibacillus sp. YN15]